MYTPGTPESPEMYVEPRMGLVVISGISFHGLEVFEALFQTLKGFTAQPGKPITLHVRFSYLNTTASRRFLELMNLLEDYSFNQDGKVSIHWYYKKGDEDMRESGKEYAEEVGLNFTLIAY